MRTIARAGEALRTACRSMCATCSRRVARGGPGSRSTCFRRRFRRSRRSSLPISRPARALVHGLDLFAPRVADAIVVPLYLLPTSVPKREPKLLAELAPGARVVSHDYPSPDWPHDRFVKLDVPEKGAITGTPRTTLYLN